MLTGGDDPLPVSCGSIGLIVNILLSVVICLVKEGRGLSKGGGVTIAESGVDLDTGWSALNARLACPFLELVSNPLPV